MKFSSTARKIFGKIREFDADNKKKKGFVPGEKPAVTGFGTDETTNSVQSFESFSLRPLQYAYKKSSYEDFYSIAQTNPFVKGFLQKIPEFVTPGLSSVLIREIGLYHCLQ
jgi:hypothetical protein